METKQCYKCKHTKLVKDFFKDRKRKDGLHPACKQCKSEREKLAYQNNKEWAAERKIKMKKRISEKILINRRYVYDYKSIHSCIDCGEKDPIVLDFDHQNDKTANISRLVRQGRSLPIIQKEIDKCVIRCSNCHRKKTAKDFDWYSDLKNTKRVEK